MSPGYWNKRSVDAAEVETSVDNSALIENLMTIKTDRGPDLE